MRGLKKIREWTSDRHTTPATDIATTRPTRPRVSEKLEYLNLELMIHARAKPLLHLYRLRFSLVGIGQAYHN